ncbi:hypothetical protein [Croceivirga thetidis]|uniref:DUF4468 domain-containing protein n=1 Tax=Croceivirga thetidis TaxID=2721623 RepID=A0ABX1GRX7_9FLAO|nr:hypothetical protein [Croceivirga thetidis]NKI32694.1 hypothetical protein [Croceivirga thetidis]
MKNTILFSLFLILSINMGLAQQNGINKIRSAPLHSGESRTYQAPYKDLVKYARQSVTESGLIIESSEKIDDTTYMIIGKAKTSAFSWGELVRVVLIDNVEKVTVRVYSKRRLKLNLAAKGNYTQTILSNIEAKLDFELE